jgi:hypothetical protein
MLGGPLTVASDKPTILGGPLTVDGLTIISSRLSVRGETASDAPTLGVGRAQAMSGAESASIGLLGYGIMHAGMSFVPATNNASQLHITFGTNANPGLQHPVVTVTENGNVGIDTTTPSEGKLVVKGAAGSHSRAYAYMTYQRQDNNYTPPPNANVSYGIWAEARIACAEFNAFSDSRIKNIIGVSDSRQDLETLTRLQVTDYTFIDVN